MAPGSIPKMVLGTKGRNLLNIDHHARVTREGLCQGRPGKFGNRLPGDSSLRVLWVSRAVAASTRRLHSLLEEYSDFGWQRGPGPILETWRAVSQTRERGAASRRQAASLPL